MRTAPSARRSTVAFWDCRSVTERSPRRGGEKQSGEGQQQEAMEDSQLPADEGNYGNMAVVQHLRSNHKGTTP